MKLQDHKNRQFEIDNGITLAQLMSAGCNVVLTNRDKLKANELKPSEDSGSNEYWMRPHWEDALIATEKLKLPSPRLQFTWVAETDDWHDKSCLYSLVIPLAHLDIRAEGKDGKHGVFKEHHALIGCTRSNGGARRPVFPNPERVDTPFRDGAHAHWDSAALHNLPIYAVCEKTVTKIEPTVKPTNL